MREDGANGSQFPMFGSTAKNIQSLAGKGAGDFHIDIRNTSLCRNTPRYLLHEVPAFFGALGMPVGMERLGTSG